MAESRLPQGEKNGGALLFTADRLLGKGYNYSMNSRKESLGAEHASEEKEIAGSPPSAANSPVAEKDATGNQNVMTQE